MQYEAWFDYFLLCNTYLCAQINLSLCYFVIIMTNALHTLCNLYHYDCFHICKDLMEGENKYEYECEYKHTPTHTHTELLLCL